MPSVSTLKVLDLEVLDEPSGLRPDVPELVDQYAWYVTVAPPIDVPSVYVVTALHERVSACAIAAVAPMAIRKTNNMVMAFLCMFPPWLI
jgi:hypothetical protein